jgi:hypothetical protein
MWFQPLEFALPALLLVGSSLLVGGFFLALAWAQIGADWANVAHGKPRKAFIALTASVLLGTVSIFALPLFTLGDLGIFTVLLIHSATFVLLIIAIISTRGDHGMVKIGSRVLFLVNLPLYIDLIKSALDSLGMSM